jgi:hypothetical protein
MEVKESNGSTKKNNVMKKRFFLVSSIIILMITTVFGQQQNRGNFTPEDMAKRQTERVKTATGCDAATAAKIEAMYLKFGKEMAAIREKTTDREAMREQFKTMREKQDAELKKLLTAEQFKKYQAAMEEMRKNRPQGGGGQQ